MIMYVRYMDGVLWKWRTILKRMLYIQTIHACSIVEPLIKDPPKKGTTSIHRILPISLKVYMQFFSTSEKRTASLQGTQCLVPNCPLLRGSTVRARRSFELNSTCSSHAMRWPYYMVRFYIISWMEMMDSHITQVSIINSCFSCSSMIDYH